MRTLSSPLFAAHLLFKPMSPNLKNIGFWGGVLLLSCVDVITAHAQSVAPLTQTVRSFGESYIAQIEIGNTYKSSQRSEMNVYNEKWEPITPFYISHKSAILGENNHMVVTVMMPFEKKQKQQTIHVCNAIIPRMSGRGAAFRGEACAKIIAKRLM